MSEPLPVPEVPSITNDKGRARYGAPGPLGGGLFKASRIFYARGQS